MGTVIIKDLLAAMIATSCNFSNPNIPEQIKIDCSLDIVNCAVTGDGKQIENNRVQACIKKLGLEDTNLPAVK